MGAGIAEVTAVAGMPVVVRDPPQFLDAAQARVEKSLAGAVEHGKMDQAKHDEVLARITFTPDLKDVAGADIVIEAVPGDPRSEGVADQGTRRTGQPGATWSPRIPRPSRSPSWRARRSIRVGWSESTSSRQFR